MGNTNLYGWPYPEPTELLTNAHAHIRALAEAASEDLYAVSQSVAPSAASYFAANGGAGSNVAAGTSQVVGFTPAAAGGGWAWSTDRVVYTGPSRIALISATVRVSVQAAPAKELATFVRALVNGNVANETRQYLHTTTVDDILSASLTATVTTLGIFNSGDNVQIEVANSSAFGESINIDGTRYLSIAGLALL